MLPDAGISIQEIADKSATSPTRYLTGVPLYDILIDTVLFSVDGSSFSEMDTLRYVIMGENIQTLGGAMFGKCTNMEAFVIRTVTPPTISDTFKDCNCLIFVPDESVEAYKTATNWSKYADRIKPLSEYTKEV